MKTVCVVCNAWLMSTRCAGGAAWYTKGNVPYTISIRWAREVDGVPYKAFPTELTWGLSVSGQPHSVLLPEEWHPGRSTVQDMDGYDISVFAKERFSTMAKCPYGDCRLILKNEVKAKRWTTLQPKQFPAEWYYVRPFRRFPIILTLRLSQFFMSIFNNCLVEIFYSDIFISIRFILII